MILQNDSPEMHFLLFDQGKDERWLRCLAVGLSNVTFAGFRENLGVYLAALDLFVFPSLQDRVLSSWTPCNLACP